MGKKILVIEDDIDILNNIIALLREMGYSAFRAENGCEGVKTAKKVHPDLVICDILMPCIDGYEVLKEFLNDKVLQTIPFIFLTAKNDKKDMRKGMIKGADDYIVKPFKAMDLIKSIETRFKRKHAFKAAKYNEDNNRYTLNDKILVKVRGKTFFIKVSQISHIVSERQYTSINHVNGKSFLMRKSIASWEEKLPKNNFIRIHRSTIINFDLIESIENCGNSRLKLYLKNHKCPFIVSRRYYSKLRNNTI